MSNSPSFHIAHVLFRFAVGGLENGLVNIINRLDPTQYRHSIICLTDYDPEFATRLTGTNVTLYALGKKEGNDFGVWLRAFRLLRKIRPTHLHTRNFVAMEMNIPGFLARVPARIHGEHGWDVGDLDGSNPRYQRLRRLLGLTVHHFIALSRHIESYLLDAVGLPATRVSRICNGVDHERFRPQLREQNKALVFGTAGRMKTVKNQPGLCRAFAALLARRPELRDLVRLRLVGDGPLRTECENVISEAGIDDIVDFVGESGDVSAELARMDVFVLPSLTEGISNTILEAMAAGLPVVATAVGGNSELVEDGVTGALVPADDVAALAAAMAQYIDAPEVRRAHAAAGRARVEANFTIDAMVDAYDRLYRQLAA